MNCLREITKMRIAGLFLICLLATASDASAAYEVISVTPNVPVNTPTQWTDDLTVSWQAPTTGAGDTLNGFIYKWNDSDTALLDVEFNISSGNDGFIPTTIPLTVIKDKADLANLDLGNLLYLHIKTFYLSGGLQQAYSNDVVVGAFMIDNVAPTGTVRVVNANGNDITSTSNTNIKLKLLSSPDTTKVYLNESSAILTALQLAYSTDVEYPFADTTPGAKTIYAWFEDAVGNISSSPATDTVTLLAQSAKPGDVNGDGDITLDDVKLAFSFFLGGAFTGQQFTGANVYDDGDGNTSISLHDVKGVFTLFLGGTL